MGDPSRPTCHFFVVFRHRYRMSTQETHEIKNRVILAPDHVKNASSSDVPGTHYGTDDAFDLEKFQNGFDVRIIRLSPTDMEFDLVGIDASIANAFRRIMISEIPTMAIEHVFIMNNTSIIPDEILAHRLGLIPIKAEPYLFTYRNGEMATDLNTLVFGLQVKCAHRPAASPDGLPMEKYVDAHVTSSYIVWKPAGDQLKRQSESHYARNNPFAAHWKAESERYGGVLESVDRRVDVPEADADLEASLRHAVRPLFPDTLVAKLRPGQVIDMELHAVKGIGREHAKWSPVSPASYRLLPTIDLLAPIRGDDAKLFQGCFPAGVIGLKDVTVDGKKTVEAVVLDARRDTVSRECLRYPQLADKVRLGLSVESLGQYHSPSDIVMDSIKVLIAKCHGLKKAITTLAVPSQSR